MEYCVTIEIIWIFVIIITKIITNYMVLMQTTLSSPSRLLDGRGPLPLPHGPGPGGGGPQQTRRGGPESPGRYRGVHHWCCVPRLRSFPGGYLARELEFFFFTI